MQKDAVISRAATQNRTEYETRWNLQQCVAADNGPHPRGGGGGGCLVRSQAGNPQPITCIVAAEHHKPHTVDVHGGPLIAKPGCWWPLPK
jgi:hypothetical protein